MPTQRDYYEVLGVPRGASDADIKRAYRELARTHHPDVVREKDKASAEARFKQINEAYAVLSDADKRARYDRFGTVETPSGFGGFAGDGFTDIFDLFFGGGATQRRTGPERGADLRFDLTVPLEEVLAGVEREISFSHLGRCEVCGGAGSADRSGPSTCPDCKGSGQIRIARSTMLGHFVSTTTCARCGGTGGVIANPCSSCKGRGRKEMRRRLKVKVPAGVENGTRLRYAGMGEAGERGGPSGDLYVFVSTPPHEIFERAGADLRCLTTISFSQAALGGKLEVEALDGPATIDIPAGTQPQTTFRVPGRGLPRVHGGGRGDLYVDVAIRVPTKLTRMQKELLAEFARAGGEDLEAKGFFKKVKEAFGGE